MRTTAAAAFAAAVLAAGTMPGCLIIDGSHNGSNYRGYGSVERMEFESIVAANTQNRIGEDRATVLGRYPAEHVSLVHSEAKPGGEEILVYRVYARERSRSTTFERFLVFENDRLAMLTDDRGEIPGLGDGESDG
jgi:hypothetical protein